MRPRSENQPTVNSLLLTIGFVLVLAFSTLFAAPLFVNWNDYRAVFEEQASALVGRPVAIRGEIEARIMPAPVLRLHDVAIADADGSFETPFARVETVTADLSPGSLLQGAIDVRDLRLTVPVLRLAVDEDGSLSWDAKNAPKPKQGYATGFSVSEVSIDGGRIEYIDAATGRALALTDIVGSLVMRDLAGPYRFTGQVSQAGVRRAVRFATGRVDAAGRVPLKAIVDDPDGAMVYTVEGAIPDWRATPAFEGAFTARAVAKPEPDAPAEASALPADAPFEASAKLDATTEMLSFRELEVTLRQRGRSQTLKGSASVDLARDMKIEGDLSARFLDADLLFAAKDNARVLPGEALSRLAGFLIEHRNRAPIGSMTIAVEQLNAGGDLVRDIKLAMATDEQGVKIDSLSLAGPGGSILQASGLLSGETSAPRFAGPVEIEGSQADTLLRWLAHDPGQALRTEIGAFSLAGDLDVSRNLISVAELRGELDGAAFSGQVEYEPAPADGRGSLALTLKSERLDLNRALADAVTLDDLLDTPEEQRSEQAEELFSPRVARMLGALAGIDADVEIAFGAVALPGMAEGPLDAQFSYRDGTLDIARLSFNAGDSIGVQGQGRIEQLTKAPSGKVDFALTAANENAAKLILESLGLADWMGEDERRIAVLAPLDLAIGVEAQRSGKVSNVALDIAGSAGETNLAVKGTFEGRIDNFEKGAIDGEVTLTSPNGRQIVELIAPGRAANLGDGEVAANGEGVLRITAKGSPGSGMATSASLNAALLDVRFDGQSRWSDGWLALDGDIAASAPDDGLAYALADLAAPPDRKAAFDLRGKIGSERGVYSLTEISGSVADADIGGTASLDLAQARPVVTADVTATRLSLAALLGLSVAWDRNPATEGVVADGMGQGNSVWPSRAFGLGDASADLNLKIAAPKVALFEGVEASEGRVELWLRPNVLQLTKFEAELFGGRFTGSGKLEGRGTGAALEGTIDLSDAELAPVGEAIAGRVIAEGSVGLSLTVNGEGLSPSGLVAGLEGKGQFTLGDGMLRNLSAEPLKDVAAQAAKRDGGQQTESLVRDLAPKLTSGAFDFKPASIPFELRAGTLRVSDANLLTEGARAEFRAYVELVSLRLDSEWNMRLSGGDARLADMPPVNLVIAGPLSEAGELSATVATAAVERYFTMRRMEADVEELENLDVGGGNQDDERSDVKPAPEIAPAEDAPSRATKLDPKIKSEPLNQSAAVVAPEAEPAPEPIAAVPPPVNSPPPLDNPQWQDQSRQNEPALESQPEPEQIQVRSEPNAVEPLPADAAPAEVASPQSPVLRKAEPRQDKLNPSEFEPEQIQARTEPEEAEPLPAAAAPAEIVTPKSPALRKSRSRKRGKQRPRQPEPEQIEARTEPDPGSEEAQPLPAAAAPEEVTSPQSPTLRRAKPEAAEIRASEIESFEIRDEELPWLTEAESAPARTENVRPRARSLPRRRARRAPPPDDDVVDFFRRLGGF